MFIYLSSTDSPEFYPQNEPYEFTVELPENLNLEGNWHCALLSFSQPVSDDVTIFCDILDYSFIQNTYKPVLHQISEQDIYFSDFPNLHYMKVKDSSIKRIKISILKSTNLTPPSPAPADSRTQLALHFKKL